MKRRLFAAILAATMVLLLLPATALAAPATSVEIGGTAYTADAAGTGWSLAFGSETVLTLNGYTGAEISADGDLKVILTGTNTVTGSAEEPGLNAVGSLDLSGGGTLHASGGAGRPANNGEEHGLASWGGELRISDVTVVASGGSGGTNDCCGVFAIQNLVIDNASVTATAQNKSSIHASGHMTVQNASTVSGSNSASNADFNPAVNAWTITVTGGSSLTGTTGGGQSFGVSASTIAVSDGGSRIRGVNSGANATGAGIAADNGITGAVIAPTGGAIGAYSFPMPLGQTLYTVLSGNRPALAATLMESGGGGGTEPVPDTGDDSLPLL